MSFNYSGLASTATRLINKFGGPIVLNIKTSGAGDPLTGANGDTYSSDSVIGVKLNFMNADIDGTLIRIGDVKVLIDGAFTLTQDDRLTIGTKQYEIINADPLNPGDTRLITTVQCRR